MTREDDLQLAGLRILQEDGVFPLGLDAVLLADFARVRARDRVADFGTGSGALPLLLSGRGKGRAFDAFELDGRAAALARKNMALNGLEARVTIREADVRQARAISGADRVDAVLCNPPYGAPGTESARADRNARSRGAGELPEWLEAAYGILRRHGRFAMVYPAPQMLLALQALARARLTPKRIRLVYPRADRPAILALLEGVRDAAPLLQPEPPLILRDAAGRDSAELKRIYHLP